MGGTQPCLPQRQRRRLKTPLLGEIVVAEGGKIRRRAPSNGSWTVLAATRPEAPEVQCVALDRLAKYDADQRVHDLCVADAGSAPRASRIAAVRTEDRRGNG